MREETAGCCDAVDFGDGTMGIRVVMPGFGLMKSRFTSTKPLKGFGSGKYRMVL